MNRRSFLKRAAGVMTGVVCSGFVVDEMPHLQGGVDSTFDPRCLGRPPRTGTGHTPDLLAEDISYGDLRDVYCKSTLEYPLVFDVNEMDWKVKR